MDLREVLDDYVVTEVPGRDPLLRIVWSEPDDDEADGEVVAEDQGALAILDDYRITRVPQAS